MVQLVKALSLLVFFCLAAAVYALCAWLHLRYREPWRRSKDYWREARRSPIFFSYLLACTSTFLVFGPAHLQKPFSEDSEPLPNGYVLNAPFERASVWSAPRREQGFSRIEYPSESSRQTVNGYVRSLEVEGPFVFGAYNWRYDSSPDKNTDANQGYFAFDTRKGKVLDFSSAAELSRLAGHALNLTEAESFHSSDIRHKQFLILERVIVLGSPFACTFVFLMLRKRLSNPRLDFPAELCSC
jgi:hypothetical protein